MTGHFTRTAAVPKAAITGAPFAVASVPWRIGALIVLVGVIIGAAVVLSARPEVFTRIMMAVQQERITPAPSPVQVDEQAETAYIDVAQCNAIYIRQPDA